MFLLAATPASWRSCARARNSRAAAAPRRANNMSDWVSQGSPHVRYDRVCQVMQCAQVGNRTFDRAAWRLVTIDQSAIRARSRANGHPVMIRPEADQALPNSTNVPPRRCTGSQDVGRRHSKWTMWSVVSTTKGRAMRTPGTAYAAIGWAVRTSSHRARSRNASRRATATIARFLPIFGASRSKTARSCASRPGWTLPQAH
jgi:hypothetical protein